MPRYRWLISMIAIVLATSLSSWGSFAVSVSFGPPPLPVYVQPVAPGPGYYWVPGYWSWSPDFDDYYWVPGTWVRPPAFGLLWTPGYWGFAAGVYTWFPGYWGPTVGFYGGINYGFGYPGHGYYGGYWRGHDFYYNRTVNNVNITNIHNVYNQTVINNNSVNRVAFNGGPGGAQARPTQQELAARSQQHVGPTAAQNQHQLAARSDRAQFASGNHGAPAVVATPKAGALNSPEAKRASLPTLNRQAHAPTMARNAAPAPQANQQSRAQHNVPRPPVSQQAPRRAQQSVPRSPQHSQAAQRTQQQPFPRPNTQALAHNAPPPNVKQSRPQPVQNAHNAPPARVSQRRATAPQHTAPQRQVRQVQPMQHVAPQPRPTPQMHAAARPQQHQASPPREQPH